MSFKRLTYPLHLDIIPPILLDAVLKHKAIPTERGIKVTVRDRASCSEESSSLAENIASLEERITELRSELEALHHSEVRYKALVESLQEGVMRVDALGKIIYANLAAAKLLGYDSTAELIGQSTSEFYADPEQRKALLQIYMSEGRTSPYEMQIRRRDGSAVHALCTGQAYKDDQGGLLFLEGTFMDITEHKLMEASQALARSTESIIEALGDGLIVMERNGNLSSINPAFEAMTGYSKEDFLKRSSADLLPKLVKEADREGVRKILKLAQDGNLTRSLYLTLLTRDGRELPVAVSLSFIRDANGDPVHLVGCFKDISDMKRSEEALSQSEERYRILFNSSPVGIGIITFGGRLLKANNTMGEMLGVGLDDLDKVEIKSVYAHPDEHQQVLALLKNTGTVRELEVTFRRMNGETFPAILNIEKQVLDGAEVLLTSARDISEQKRAEEESIKLKQQFQRTQKLEALGRLAGGIAHDFNNLMTMVKGYSELLLLQMDGQNPHQEYVESIKKAGEKATRLTKQLLAFSRKQIQFPRELNINDIVSDMEQLISRLLGEDIDFIIVLNPETATIKADPAQLEQIIMNLVLNARDAMPQGGKIYIRTDNRELSAEQIGMDSDIRPGPYVMLSIRDMGTGMDRLTKAHVYEPFFTTKDEGKGTGLGLSTVYGIIKQIGGHIEFTSELNQGTTFNLYFPKLTSSRGEKLDSAPLVAPTYKGNETILIVEDDEDVLYIAAITLRLHGYEVLEARSGDEAIGLTQKHEGPIHLVISDVIMAGMKGPELIKRMKKLSPETKSLYMSGYPGDIIQDIGAKGKDFALLQKPFGPSDLTRMVRKVLGKKEGLE